MKIAGVYSFKGGTEAVTAGYPALLTEVNAVIKAVDSAHHKTKKSIEKTMMGRMLFSPTSINKAFKAAFAEQREWQTVRIDGDALERLAKPQ